MMSVASKPDALSAARSSNLWQAFGWTVFAGLVFKLTFEIGDPFAFDGGLRPSYWPRGIAILLLISAICLGARCFISRVVRNGAADTSNDEEISHPLARVFVVGLPLILYVLICEYIGFLITTPIFLVSAMYAIGRGRASTLKIFMSAATVYLALIGVLVVLFNTPLPSGIGAFYTWNAEIVNVLR